MAPPTTTKNVALKPRKGAVSSSKNQPKTPKAPRSTEEQLRRYFTALCAQIDGGFAKNAIKTCDKILRLLPDDADTIRTKFFLLLQTDQYQEALNLLESSKDSGANELNKAYVLYRLHREDDAREILDTLGAESIEADRGLQHLDAQLKYRSGDYTAARDIYDVLLDTCPPDTDEHPDILTNLAAAQAHIDFLEKGYLEGVHSLPSTSSAAALEASPPPTIPSHHTIQSTLKASTSAAERSAPAAKSTRKSRIPKHVVPGVTPSPDPERWLKKRERTSFAASKARKAGKRGVGYAVGATQGAAVSDVAAGGKTSAPRSGANATGHAPAKKGKKGR